ncbi:hypothetical protein LIA77_10420 [Sarocladium implicatum]|nr:hypothetical protein LIA77_10420 [Sarocladium implicatum]
MEEHQIPPQTLAGARKWLEEGPAAAEIANQREHLEHIKSDTVKGTGGWIMNHLLMQQWLDPNQNPASILWVTGSSGLGKSYLCASTSEALRDIFGTQGSASTVHVTLQCRDQDRPQTALDLFGHMAWQLIRGLMQQGCHQMSGAMAALVRDDIEQADLQELICMLLEDIRETTFILLDGFDETIMDDYEELSEDTSSGALTFVKFMVSQAQSHPQMIRLWYSSRYSPSIERLLGDNILHLSLTASVTVPDLVMFIEEKLENKSKQAQDEIMQGFTASVASLIIGFDDFRSGSDDIRHSCWNPMRRLFFSSRKSFCWANNILKDWLATASQRPRDKEASLDVEHFYGKLTADIEAPCWRTYLSILSVATRPLLVVEMGAVVTMLQDDRAQCLTVDAYKMAFDTNSRQDDDDSDFDQQSESSSSVPSIQSLSDTEVDTEDEDNDLHDEAAASGVSESESEQQSDKMSSDGFQESSNEEGPPETCEVVRLEEDNDDEEKQQYEIVAVCEEQPDDDSDSSVEGCGWGIYD